MEIRKVRVDNRDNTILSKHRLSKVEIPSSVTLATLSSVCVGRLEAKVLHLSPIKVLQSGKLRIIQAHLLDPSDTTRVVLWQEFLSAVAEGNAKIFSD